MKFLVVLILLELYSSVNGCEVGWVQSRTKCYMFSHTAASWADADAILSYSILILQIEFEDTRIFVDTGPTSPAEPIITSFVRCDKNKINLSTFAVLYLLYLVFFKLITMRFFVSLLMLLELYNSGEGCDIGWIRHHTKCYMLSNTTATWAEAESICNAFHSILAEPRSHDESMFLIGQSLSENKDLQPVKVTDFYPGQPNENTSANCVALRIILLLVFQDYWDDLPCSEHFNFICETKEKSNGDVLG
uniref:C-type lectin domain-containing protein n=1 Tax=Magallana gigas TaxID=29159 RepID=A0A8W8MXG6_MAGGI